MKIIESNSPIDIGFRELRLNPDVVIQGVNKGNTYLVKRKSKPLFRIVPVEQEVWETFIDLTEINKGGVEIKALLSQLEKAKVKNPQKYGRSNTEISR